MYTHIFYFSLVYNTPKLHSLFLIIKNSNAKYIEEILTLKIRDVDVSGNGIGSNGIGGSLNDTVVIPIHVSAVNDQPSIVTPRTQTVVLSGYEIQDVDVGVEEETCGTIKIEKLKCSKLCHYILDCNYRQNYFYSFNSLLMSSLQSQLQN